ncbi:MAG: hypothetical protein AB4040_21265 [Synechococcus sp.]
MNNSHTSNRKVFLHIGTAKTGSTSIQTFLSHNRDLLYKNNYLYPSSPGKKNHLKLASFALDDSKMPHVRKLCGIKSRDDIIPFRESFTSDILNEVHSSKATNIIFSNEHCDLLLLDSEVKRLHDLISQISSDTTIILYVRRQDDFLTTMYSTMIKNGKTTKFSLPRKNDRYNFYALANRYAKYFGKNNIKVRLFKSELLKNSDVVDDFLDLVGIPDINLLETVNKSNLSLDVKHLDFLRRLNQYVPRVQNGSSFKERGNLVKLLEKFSTGPTVTLDRESLDLFMSNFHESNTMLAKEYLSKNDGNLFNFPRKSKNVDFPVDIDIDSAFEIFGQLWIEKERELISLRKKIKSK